MEAYQMDCMWNLLAFPTEITLYSWSLLKIKT